MKIKKGAKWLKRNFVEHLEQLLEDNHVVELNDLIKFDGREQFIRNMLTRGELAQATNDDIKWQNNIELTRKTEALKDVRLTNKLEEEEAALKAVMGL